MSPIIIYTWGLGSDGEDDSRTEWVERPSWRRALTDDDDDEEWRAMLLEVETLSLRLVRLDLQYKPTKSTSKTPVFLLSETRTELFFTERAFVWITGDSDCNAISFNRWRTNRERERRNAEEREREREDRINEREDRNHQTLTSQFGWRLLLLLLFFLFWRVGSIRLLVSVFYCMLSIFIFIFLFL